MKEKIILEIKKWIKKLVEMIRKDPVRNIFLLFLLPILIHAMAEALIDFSLFTAVGYYTACIYGFSKIIEDPYRVIKWGVGYAIGASVFSMVLSNLWPVLKEGTIMAFISGGVILYVLIMLWLKSKELKES